GGKCPAADRFRAGDTGVPQHWNRGTGNGHQHQADGEGGLESQLAGATTARNRAEIPGVNPVDRSLLAIYSDEQESHLSRIRALLDDLANGEADARNAAFDELMRRLHTL